MKVMRFSRAATSGIVLVALSTLLTSCGRSQDSNRDAAIQFQSASPAASVPVSSLKWNLPGGEPRSLDPVQMYSGSDLQVAANVCESLLTLQPDGELQPGLASSIDRPDDTTYVVHLRESVAFSDGKPMTAADVVFSLDRVRDPNSGAYWGFFAEHVESVTATDPSTVVIRMTQSDVGFYEMLATPLAQIVQKDFVEAAGDQYGSPAGGVMCTGPYIVSKWTPGSNIVLTANDNWWKRSESPQMSSGVTFTFLTSDSTVTSALLNGDIDGSFDIPNTTLDRLAAASNGTVYMSPSTRQLVLVPTGLSASGALSNPSLRDAFAKSVDYAGILGTILNHVGQPLRAAMPPGGWGYAQDTYRTAYENLPVPTQDLAGARSLVRESAVTDPAVTLAVPADIPEYVKLGEAIQSGAQQAGFRVTLKSLPGADFNALFSDPDARAKVDVFLADYYADVPDPTMLYMQFGIPGGAADFGGYDNSEVADLLKQARTATDRDQRADLTVKAQEILTKDNVWMPLAYPQLTLFLNNSLGGATAAFPSIMYSPWLPSIGGR